MDFDIMFKGFKFANKAEEHMMALMFNNYMDKIPENFYLNQFELAKEYPGTTFDMWLKFIKQPIFNTWKNEQIAYIAGVQTDKALAGSEDLSNREQLNLITARQNVLSSEKEKKKDTVIVLPESLFYKDEVL